MIIQISLIRLNTFTLLSNKSHKCKNLNRCSKKKQVLKINRLNYKNHFTKTHTYHDTSLFLIFFCYKLIKIQKKNIFFTGIRNYAKKKQFIKNSQSNDKFYSVFNDMFLKSLNKIKCFKFLKNAKYYITIKFFNH